MIHLFDEKELYTDEARELIAEFNGAIRPIIKKYAKKGFSIRDMESILFTQVVITSALALLKADSFREDKNEA